MQDRPSLDILRHVMSTWLSGTYVQCETTVTFKDALPQVGNLNGPDRGVRTCGTRSQITVFQTRRGLFHIGISHKEEDASKRSVFWCLST